ncbi:prolyl oligopeptidase family serine peptidase [Thalassomonas actiniarum]|uniref:Prolyl oligopeptidase family serine peptidase n=1 Tax=Thalassomonas actiniarum TaxID=485447 RepID=A0AAF0C517_9GAMM|nr:prolyl oligopeptidase family serine peptidase [Thalassomonas actiniarum]WDE00599.1 prolyl oligopeptidase family serine peptidase [Thalassomonas actiniarum]
MRLFNLICLFLGLVIPQLLTAQPLSADKLFTNADNAMVKLSPSGDYITSYFRDEKNHYLDLFKVSKHKSVSRVNLGNDNALDGYNWLNERQLYLNIINEERKISFVGELVGEKIQLSRIKTQGYLVHRLPKQANKVMFAKRRRARSTAYDLYIIGIAQLAKGDFEQAYQVDHDGANISDYIYDEHLERIITREYDEEEKTFSIKYAALADGEWHRVITLKDDEYSFRTVHFLDEHTVAVLTDKDSDKMLLREFDINSQMFGKIIYQHPKYDITAASFDVNGHLAYVTYKKYGLTQTLYFEKDKAHFIKRLAKTFSNQEVYVIDHLAKKKISLLYVNGSTEPGQYFIYNQQSDQAKRLFVSFSDLQDLSFSPSEQIAVKTADGIEIEAFLTLAQEIDHSTLLVMPHGGPIGVQESDRFNKEVQYYASRGFSVLRVNFRGSSGFGKAFAERGVGEFGQLIEQDIMSAVNQVTKTHKFKHMCAIGASYGGYSAAMLAIKHPQLYDCVVGAFGIYDLPLLFNASNLRSGEEYRERIAKTVGDFHEGLIDVSPLYLFKKLKAPILLIAGREDNIADFEHSNRFKYILSRSKHPVEFMFYQDTAHGHSDWQGDRHEAAITSEFLMRTLQLALPAPETLSAGSKQAIANDFANIADGYTGDDNVDNDQEKAVLYYQKAAAYDHARANFNLGSYYHSGEQLPLDLDKAATYYQKSAALGFASAHGRLGRMYMEGEHFAQNWQQALIHLGKAQELNDSPSNNIRLARFYCTAPQAYKNVPRCLELMALRQYEKRSKASFNAAVREMSKALVWIFAEADLTEEELKLVKQFTIAHYELTATDVSLENIVQGAFQYHESKSFGGNGEFRLVKPDGRMNKYNRDKTLHLGVLFDPDIPGIDGANERTAVAARWFTTTADGRREYLQHKLLYGAPIGEWDLLYEIYDMDESMTMTLEIYDLNQNRLYSKEYQIPPQILSDTAI